MPCLVLLVYSTSCQSSCSSLLVLLVLFVVAAAAAAAAAAAVATIVVFISSVFSISQCKPVDFAPPQAQIKQLIERNNPRRESVYGKTNDRLERCAMQRKHETVSRKSECK